MVQPVYDFPEHETVGHDLDPNADGDLVIHVEVSRQQALLIAANSQDNNNWSASVRWIDSEADDNEFQSESGSDISLSGVDNDSARLTRKGPVAEVTFSSDAAAGTQNRLNAYLDAHR